MSLYENCFRWYGGIPENDGSHNRCLESFFSALRFLTRLLSTKLYFPFYFRKKRYNTEKIQNNMVVSLTSFPARLETLWLTIESIKHQSVLPRKIVLYLIEEEVSYDKIPQSLKDQEDDLFEIRFRNIKMRAHGKYHYAMQEFPDDIIATVDDDMIYPPYMLRVMIESHEKYPEAVLSNQTAQLLLNGDGTVKTYAEWKWLFKEQDYTDGFIIKERLIPLGVCGAMYPPHLLYKDTLNFELCKKLSYLNDDLWLYAMTVLSDHHVVKTPLNPLDVIPIDIKNNTTLFSVNGGENQNDIQINQIREYYNNTIGKDIAKFGDNRNIK